MSTNREGTLQIKQFAGVNRFIQGTLSEPNSFDALQNMYVKNPGELKSLNGVTKINLNDLPNVSEIVQTQFLEDENEKRLVVFYNPDTSALESPASDMVFTPRSGGTVTRDVLVECIAGGDGHSWRSYTGKTISSTNGCVVTLGTDPGKRIRCMNFYVTSADGNYVYTASAFRRDDGSFPTKVIIFAPGSDFTTADPEFPCILRPASFSYSTANDANGRLEGGRTYYFGVAPWINATRMYQEVNFWDQHATPQIFSVFLPVGHNKITFIFDFMPATGIPTSTTTNVALSGAISFMGISPNDMMPVGDWSYDGFISSPHDGYASKTPFSTTTIAFPNTNVNTSTDYIQMPNVNVPEGAVLRFTAGTIGGLTTNTYYYAKNSTYNGTDSLLQLAATKGGAAIDLTSASGTINFTYSFVTATVGFLPRSMDHIPMENELDFVNNALGVDPFARANASEGRYTGICNLHADFAVDIPPSELACFSANVLDINADSMLENFSPNSAYSYDLTVNPANFNDPNKYVLAGLGFQPQLGSDTIKYQTRQYRNRIYAVNGYNAPIYSNGYLFRPALPSFKETGQQVFPITKFIEVFKNRMCLGSNISNPFYQEGYVYFSDALDFQDFNDTDNVLPINTGDQSLLVGFGVYSQDLSNSGVGSFLVAGKQNCVFTWNGDPTVAFSQIAKSAGFISPNCMANTDLGPVFVSYDNAYLFTSAQNIIPIGDAIKDILQGLTPDQQSKVVAYFHGQHVKIGYPTDSDLDSEIWLKLLYENGGINRYWSGPHKMKSYTNAAVAQLFDGMSQVRTSFLGADLYERDDPGSFLNDGEPIQRLIRIDNLGLNADHFLKVLNRIYMALRLESDETFQVTLVAQDGSQNIVVETNAVNEGNNRKLHQFWIPQRYLTRVQSVTFQNESNSDLSIYDISLLFQQLRRRMI